MADNPLKITLFGEFGLVNRGRQFSSLNGDRPISLLAYLLLHRHKAVSRQHLAFTFWPDSGDSQARANLRNLFYSLRQTLPAADNYLLADSMTLQWRPDSDFSLDVAEFEAALAAAKIAVSDQEKRIHLETAVSLYKGDLLPDNYDDWIIPQREELRQAYLDALYHLVRLLEQIGDYRAAIRISQRLIQHDPLDEPAYVQLMRLHALSGDRTGVRRVYERCITALRRELDVEPGPATQAAYEQLLHLEAAPASTLESENRPDASPSRAQPLPIPATPFIGREAEMAHLAELLADPACRLLTIVGPGGIGKTRLALQTAVGHQPVFSDGVIWVSLTALRTPEQLAAAIAEALYYRLSGRGSAEAELLHVLAQKEMLLVLDNFEHLLDAADLLTAIVTRTTAVKLLVTSRQALALQEEWRFDLQELPIPYALAGADLADNSAIQLFVQSARRAASTLILTEKDYPAIAHICQLVGGMPLGIELAASWIRLLPCTEIVQEIEKSLDFLTVTLRNLPPRHRSLRAVFDHSWELLTSAEQQILVRLSIFSGGFTREAALQVASADLSQLSALAARSLVQRTAVGRHNLHNIIRQYASDHLHADPDAAQETTRQHSAYYLQWLADQDIELRGARQKEGLTAVAVELSNIRAAWQWAAAHRQNQLLRPASFPLFYFYELRGLLHEGEAIFRLAAESLQSETIAADRETEITIGGMHTYQAYLSFRMGDLMAAEALLQQTVTKLQTLGDDTLLSYAMCYLALVAWSLGRFVEAVDHLQTALTLAVRQGDAWGIGMAQVYIGMVKQDQGQLWEARQQLTDVQASIRMLGDPRLIANALLIAGRTNLLLGQFLEAEQQLNECLEIMREIKDPNSFTYATLYLGMAKQAQGDLTAARQFIEQSMASFSGFNDLVGLERASVAMGFLEIDAGNFQAAQFHFLTFLQGKQRIHAIRYILAAVVGTAVVRAHAGDAFSALVWSISVLQHQGVDWEAKQRAQTLRAQLEPQLTPDQINAAQQIALQKPFESVLADILAP